LDGLDQAIHITTFDYGGVTVHRLLGDFGEIWRRQPFLVHY